MRRTRRWTLGLLLPVVLLPLGCTMALPMITVADDMTGGVLAVVCGAGLCACLLIGLTRLLFRRTTRL